MTYENFKNSLNERIFKADLSLEILQTVIENPQRYTGIFRITNAKTKLIQNITQSHEIKFGDFLEDVFTEYIREMGFDLLDKNINSDLNADQLFTDKKEIFLIEQKVIDDHDSTKKRGQFDNLIRKIMALKEKYPNKKINACMWFCDDALKKNKKYYLERIDSNTDTLVTTKLYYGAEIFAELFKRMDVWQEIVSHLSKNKNERSKEILEVPDFDNSLEIKESLKKLKEQKPTLIKKLLSDKDKYKQLRAELFPSGETLKGL